MIPVRESSDGRQQSTQGAPHSGLCTWKYSVAMRPAFWDAQRSKWRYVNCASMKEWHKKKYEFWHGVKVETPEDCTKENAPGPTWTGPGIRPNSPQRFLSKKGRSDVRVNGIRKWSFCQSRSFVEWTVTPAGATDYASARVELLCSCLDESGWYY